MKYRTLELKKQYLFTAIKERTFRTIRIKAYDLREAEEKVRQKFPEFTVELFRQLN